MLLTSMAPFKYSLIRKSYRNHIFKRYFCPLINKPVWKEGGDSRQCQTLEENSGYEVIEVALNMMADVLTLNLT